MADKVYPPVTFEEFQPTSYEVWKEEAAACFPSVTYLL